MQTRSLALTERDKDALSGKFTEMICLEENQNLLNIINRNRDSDFKKIVEEVFVTTNRTINSDTIFILFLYKPEYTTIFEYFVPHYGVSKENESEKDHRVLNTMLDVIEDDDFIVNSFLGIIKAANFFISKIESIDVQYYRELVKVLHLFMVCKIKCFHLDNKMEDVLSRLIKDLLVFYYPDRYNSKFDGRKRELISLMFMKLDGIKAEEISEFGKIILQQINYKMLQNLESVKVFAALEFLFVEQQEAFKKEAEERAKRIAEKRAK